MHPIYYLNLSIPFILYLYARFSQVDKKIQNRFILIVYSLFVVLVAGTRSLDTGVDTISYYRFYEVAQNSNDNSMIISYFEPLFSAIGILSVRLGLHFVGFNLLISALTMIFFSLAIDKTSDNVTMSIFLYTSFSLFQQMMNQVRQGLAMMIILYAVTFLKEDKIRKFIFWVFIAGLIHTSCFIVLLLVFIYKIEINARIIRIYAITGVFGMIFSRIIFSIIIRYTSYGHLLTETWRDYSAFDKGTVINTIFRFFLLVIILIYYKEMIEINKQINVYYHMAMICMVLQLVAVMNNAIARITTYFFISNLIIIPNVFEESKRLKNSWQITYPTMIGFFLVYYFVYSYMKEYLYYNSIIF